MDTSFEQKIRERAYDIWIAAGMSDGNAIDHWLSAQHALLSESESPSAMSTVQKAKVTKRATAAKAAAKPAKTTSLSAVKQKTRAA